MWPIAILLPVGAGISLPRRIVAFGLHYGAMDLLRMRRDLLLVIRLTNRCFESIDLQYENSVGRIDAIEPPFDDEL